MTTIELPVESAPLLAVVRTVLTSEVPDAALIGGLAVTARVASSTVAYRSTDDVASSSPTRAVRSPSRVEVGPTAGIRVYPDLGIPTSGYTRIMRRSDKALSSDLQQFAIAALGEKVGTVSVSPDMGADVIVEVDGHRLAINIKTTAYATVERIGTFQRLASEAQDEAILVVADRINEPARQAIEDAGWGYLDAKSGALFLRAPGIRIDTKVAPLDPGSAARPVGVVGRAGRVVAYEILRRHYDGQVQPILTSTSKDEFDLARSSTSDAIRALAAADLFTATGAPVLPELFWELAKVWAPVDRRWLASVPDADEWGRSVDPEKPTWHLGGIEAAIVHGAPAVGAGAGPLELYVSGPVVLSIAARRYGLADPIAAAASVAVPSAHQVTAPHDSRRNRRHRGWPVVHPVAAALDIAALGDARSQQILEEWHPDGEAVWHDH